MSANRATQQHHLAALVIDIPVVAFGAGAASAYAAIRVATRERKQDQRERKQDKFNKLIAAHAISFGVVLVTNNERDFISYPGVKIENWINN